MATDRFGIPDLLGSAGAHLAPDDAAGTPDLRTLLRSIAQRITLARADTTELETVEEDDREDGMIALVTGDGSLWRFDISSVSVAGVNVLVPDDDPDEGRWLRFMFNQGSSTVLGSAVADLTALAAIAAVDRADGELIAVQADNSLWQFSAGSSATAVTGLVLTPAAGTGRWLRVDRANVAITTPPATLVALKAIAAAVRYDGMLAIVQADGSKWRFASTSVLTGDDLLVATPAAGTGRWLRADASVDFVSAAVTSATADAAALYTVPVGFVLLPVSSFWKVNTTMTTGTAAAAGLSSSNAGLSTKGDLLGGASGDLVATLVSTGAFAKGTKGTKMGTPAAVLIGGETIRYDLIGGGTFTGGSMVAHVPMQVLVAPAA